MLDLDMRKKRGDKNDFKVFGLSIGRVELSLTKAMEGGGFEREGHEFRLCILSLICK